MISDLKVPQQISDETFQAFFLTCEVQFSLHYITEAL